MGCSEMLCMAAKTQIMLQQAFKKVNGLFTLIVPLNFQDRHTFHIIHNRSVVAFDANIIH